MNALHSIPKAFDQMSYTLTGSDTTKLVNWLFGTTTVRINVESAVTDEFHTHTWLRSQSPPALRDGIDPHSPDEMCVRSEVRETHQRRAEPAEAGRV